MADDRSTKKGSKRRRRRIRAAGVTGVAVGSALMAAGGTAVALTNKRTRKVVRRARKRIPEPVDALQLASVYLPAVMDRLADGNGGSSARAKRSKKKAKKA